MLGWVAITFGAALLENIWKNASREVPLQPEASAQIIATGAGLCNSLAFALMDFRQDGLLSLGGDPAVLWCWPVYQGTRTSQTFCSFWVCVSV